MVLLWFFAIGFVAIFDGCSRTFSGFFAFDELHSGRARADCAHAGAATRGRYGPAISVVTPTMPSHRQSLGQMPNSRKPQSGLMRDYL
jgi:hypothetical protein